MSTIKVNTLTTLDGTGNITVSRPLSGSGASLTALNATQLTSGTIPIARLGNDVIDSQHYAAASIDNEHLADDAVGVAELSATGTASSSTFLRGDNSWAAAGGGMWTFISKQTVSSSPSTIDFVGLATGTYNKFRIEFYDIYPSADADIGIRLREAGGSNFTTTYYNGGSTGVAADITDNTAYNDHQVDNSYAILTTEPTNGGQGNIRHHGFVEMSGLGTTSTRPAFWGMIVGANQQTTSHGGSFYFQENNQDADGYDGIRFLLSTGTWSGGSFSLYGLKES